MRSRRLRNAIATGLIVVLVLAGCEGQTVAKGKLDQRATSVGIMALQWPKLVSVGTKFEAKVAVRNTGDQALPSLPGGANGALGVNVSYHWRGTDARIIVWDGLLTPLGTDLAPGKQREVVLQVESPKAPGRYILEIDLLQTTAFWFAGGGSQTASMVIDVK